MKSKISQLALLSVALGAFGCSEGKDDSSAAESAATAASSNSSSSSTSTSTSTSTTYTTTSVPGSLALTLPTSLISNKAASLALVDPSADPSAGGGADDECSSAGSIDGTESQGYAILKCGTKKIPGYIADALMFLYMVDSKASDIKDACVTAQGASWTSCEGKDVTVKFTKQMYASIKASLGSEDNLPSDKKTMYEAMIDQEQKLDKIIWTKHAGETLSECAEIADEQDDTEHSVEICWSSDMKVIDADMSFSLAMDDPTNPGSKLEMKGHQKMTYDGNKELFQTSDDFQMGEQIMKNTMSFQAAKATSLALADLGENATIFEANQEFSMPKMGKYKVTFKGMANEKEAVIHTHYTWPENTVSAAVLSAASVEGTSYTIMPSNQDATKAQADGGLGFFSGNGSTDVKDTMFYFGPATPPTGLKVFTQSFDETTSEMTFADSGLTFATLTVSAEIKGFYFEEHITDGEVDAFCVKNTEDGACTVSEGDLSTGNLDDAFDTAADDGALISGGLSLAVSGTNGKASAFEGFQFIVVPAGTDLADKTPADDQTWEVLALGIFLGDLSALSTTDMTGYEIQVFSTDKSAVEGGLVYLNAFDSNGNLVFRKLENVTLTATVKE